MWTDLIVTPELIQFGGICFAAGCAVTTVIVVVSIALRLRRKIQLDESQRRVERLTPAGVCELRRFQIPVPPAKGPKGFAAAKPWKGGAA